MSIYKKDAIQKQPCLKASSRERYEGKNDYILHGMNRKK